MFCGIGSSSEGMIPTRINNLKMPAFPIGNLHNSIPGHPGFVTNQSFVLFTYPVK